MITSPNLEERYIVVKITDLEAAGQRSAMQEWLRNYQIRTRDCVVVEADWPQYRTVVDMVVSDYPRAAAPTAPAVIYEMARALCNYHADLCGVNRDEQWLVFGDDFKKDVKVMLAAAPRPVQEHFGFDYSIKTYTSNTTAAAPQPSDGAIRKMANLLPLLDDALENLELHGRHNDSGYNALKDWYHKMLSATKAIDAAMGSKGE